MTNDWEWVDTGVPDPDLMATVRTVAGEYEPLVAASEFDDPLDPEAVHLRLADGIDAESSRFDVIWTDEGCSRYHYTEGDGFNYLDSASESRRLRRA